MNAGGGGCLTTLDPPNFGCYFNSGLIKVAFYHIFLTDFSGKWHRRRNGLGCYFDPHHQILAIRPDLTVCQDFAVRQDLAVRHPAKADCSQSSDVLADGTVLGRLS